MFSFTKNNSFTIFIYDLASMAQIDERQLKLILILAAKADPNKGYTCAPTQEELAHLAGWSRPTVQNVLNSILELKIKGNHIVTSQKVPKQGGGYYTVYSLHCF